MRILYITPFVVDDRSCGAAQRSALLYETLTGMGEVTVEQTRALESPWSFKGILRRGLSAVLPGVMVPLTRVALGSYDLVVVRYVRYAAYYSAWRFGPLWIDADDLPVDVCPLWARSIVSRWTDWVVRHAKGVWLANPADVKRLRGACAYPLENVPCRPVEGYRYEAPQEAKFITVAHLGYAPNYKGVDRFLRTEWLRYRAERPELEYHIIGAGLPKRYARRWARVSGVKLRGFVPDIDAEYENCCGVVCPVYEGGGTNVKVLEALVHRRPVIAPEFAFKGIDANDLPTGSRFALQVRQGLFLPTGAARRKIPVVFGVNDAYALPLWIAIRSLLDSKCPETEYDIIVLVRSMSRKNRRILQTLPGVRFVSVPEAAFRDAPVGYSGRDTYNRLMVAELLPEYDRVLWSDADVLFKSDLTAVYAPELGDCDWAGVRMECRCERDGVHNHFDANSKPYVYAAGFMVVNARRWRKRNLMEAFQQTISRYGSRLTMFDLDVLNLSCDSITSVPLDYCVFENLHSAHTPTQAPEYRFLKRVYSDAEMEAARTRPAIIHYCGRNPKVWRRSYLEIPAEYAEYWRVCPLRPGWLSRRWHDFKYLTRGIRHVR